MSDIHIASDNLHDIVERLVQTAFGASVTLGEKTELGGSNRSNVWRWQLQNSTAPASVVVKQVNTEHEAYEPDNPAFGPASRLFNEWAALQLLRDLEADFVPRFYAGDRDNGVILIEDLGTAPTLDKLLLGDNPQAAEKALVHLAQVVGQIHALTVSRQHEFHRLRTALGPLPPPPEADVPLAETELAGFLFKVVEPLKITLTNDVENQLNRLAQSRRTNRRLYTLVHADPCPDNILVAAEGVKLLDFEFARFGPASVDSVYWRNYFPTCWCFARLPVPVAERMETAYRTELVKGMPVAADDEIYFQAVVEACFYAAIEFLNWGGFDPMVDEDQWGIATIRQRVLLRFEVVAQVCDQYGYYPAVGELCRYIITLLRQQWPDDVHSVAMYPAFQ